MDCFSGASQAKGEEQEAESEMILLEVKNRIVEETLLHRFIR